MLTQDTQDDRTCAYRGATNAKWSIERQIRIASGLLILLGIGVAYTICLPFIWLSVVVALGMVLSGLTDSCALGMLIELMPWNRESK